MKNNSILLLVGLVLLGAAPSAANLEFAREMAAQGDPSGALNLVEQHLLADPEGADGLFLKGVLLVELRRAGEAEAVFERLIDVHPELPEPYNNLAVIQAAGGDYEGAVGTLRRSLQTSSSYRTAYENLTKIYSQLARDAYSQALESEPVESPEVIELVLLGNLGTNSMRAVADEPKPEARIAATEPTSVRPAEPVALPTPPADPPMPETEPPPSSAAMEESESEPAASTDVDGVALFVESWRSAWQSQSVDDYLASYSEGFEPDGGLSRRRWAEQRRERLTAPSFVRVTLAFLDEPRIDGDIATIRFLQSYESSTFQDRVTKALVLTWEGGGWKILEERSD